MPEKRNPAASLANSGGPIRDRIEHQGGYRDLVYSQCQTDRIESEIDSAGQAVRSGRRPCRIPGRHRGRVDQGVQPFHRAHGIAHQGVRIVAQARWPHPVIRDAFLHSADVSPPPASRPHRSQSPQFFREGSNPPTSMIACRRDDRGWHRQDIRAAQRLKSGRVPRYAPVQSGPREPLFCHVLKAAMYQVAFAATRLRREERPAHLAPANRRSRETSRTRREHTRCQNRAVPRRRSPGAPA